MKLAVIYSPALENTLSTECHQTASVRTWFSESSHQCVWKFVPSGLAELNPGEGRAWVPVTHLASFPSPAPTTSNHTTVSCHSLMGAPGPTIAHHYLL